MPSYEIKTDADVRPVAVADFAFGVAEQWLESVVNGGGVSSVPEVAEFARVALAQCKAGRDRLRELREWEPAARERAAPSESVVF